MDAYEQLYKKWLIENELADGFAKYLDEFDEENEEWECRHVWEIDPTDYDSEICTKCGDRKN